MKVVHKFLIGWTVGTWRPGQTSNGFWKVYYPADTGSKGCGQVWEQSLLSESYGVDKWWVAIKKKTKGKKRALP